VRSSPGREERDVHSALYGGGEGEGLWEGPQGASGCLTPTDISDVPLPFQGETFLEKKKRSLSWGWEKKRREYNKRHPAPERDVDSRVPFLNGKGPQDTGPVKERRGGRYIGSPSSTSVVLKWGHLAISGNVLVVTTGLGRGPYWRLAGRGQGCCSTPYNTRPLSEKTT